MPLRNKILAKLPEAEYADVVGRMERVTIPAGHVIYQPGEPLRYAYFPVSGVLASFLVLEDGATVDAWTVGNEGMAGIPLLIESPDSLFRVTQLVPGEALRIRAGDFREAVNRGPALSKALLQYLVVLAHRGVQNSACHQHHTIEERMCRWLLKTADQVGADEFDLTQEFLAEMLGVRRQSVNLTAGLLHQAGLIDYTRGHVAIRDRQGLEEAACECYRTVKHAYERLMRRPGD